MKRLLLCALVASACRASMIAPPTLTTECGFYDLSATCTPGTRVFFVYTDIYGLVPWIEILKPTGYAELPPDVVVPVPPAYVPPTVIVTPREEPPTVAATPEPATLNLLLILVLGGIVALIVRRRNGRQ